MNQIEQIEKYVKAQLASEHSGHGFDHIQRVVRNARLICQQIPMADSTLVEMAVLLHDVIDEKVVGDVEQARQAMVAQLTVIGVSFERQQAILTIIEHMSFVKNIDQQQVLSLEGQIVQDADRLDAIGAIGIGRTFMYGGAHGGIAYDPQIEPRAELTAANYREPTTVINHFYEKLFKLAATMNTPVAKTLATKRTQVMQDFVTEYLAEWQGER
ncbi:HD domain-containing protein [Latilactobacillus fuchuensis]|uniref:HD/PDEase domain-containing protein n=1 Tax=Latilactobacillus fuchuensis DSM 14340 = JCM 11249 TaxID=1423747 RepID=A0A0R1RYJ2_9LACO|nr:HD domain-containing protein [Latilactobacillus fuchuensis]KRL59410.1 hypothetical protein FC69_GL001663 [Latilactobacillus fuchuensis DSM 14340 = JCM 11249]